MALILQVTAATAPDVLELEARLLTAEQERQRLLGDAREQALRLQVTHGPRLGQGVGAGLKL